MNLYISDTRLENLIAEDIPYLDLTSEVLGVSCQPGSIEYFTREDCLLCGSEEVSRIIQKLGAHVTEALPSGTHLTAGQAFLQAKGPASSLHMAWRVCLNIFDHCSAISTNTERLVKAVEKGNPNCKVLTTRKSMPGTKDLATKAIMIGGASPHRLGLSETVLVFGHHIEFFDSFDSFVAQIPDLRRRSIEKKFFVEAQLDQAYTLAQAGVDGIQFDKATPEDLRILIPKLRAINPSITLIAAGGINPQNGGSYAASGVDGIATTFPFSSKPLDMSARMHAQ